MELKLGGGVTPVEGPYFSPQPLRSVIKGTGYLLTPLSPVGEQYKGKGSSCLLSKWLI